MRALFVTFDKCPNIDAGAIRTHAIACILKDEGYDVTVISMGPYNSKELTVSDIKYISFRPKYNYFLCKALAYLMFFIRLFHYIRNKKLDIIVHTQLDWCSLMVLKYYSIKNGCKLIYDAVEWFSPEQFDNGVNSLAYKLNNDYNTNLIKSPHKVISISKYLHQNFNNNNVDSFLMPVILNTKEISYVKKELEYKKRIIYAGSPGKKDYLDVIVNAITMLSDEQRKCISLKVVGCSKEQFIKNFKFDKTILDDFADNIVFLGRISREAVISEYQKADFSILIRPTHLRFAQAGFPTKLVESLATGTPVICNLTSDIGDYIKNYQNGIIVDGPTPIECARALRIVANLSSEDLKRMQIRSRKTAEEYFDYSVYANDLIKFMEGS